ncbi:MAG: hypothetical protein AABX29_01405 [Nanoarchaeota archaeon]
MGILSLFNKKSNSNSELLRKSSPIENKNWIEVYYSYEVFVNPKLDEKKIKEHLAKECIELLEICLNQKQFQTEHGEVLGHSNPKIPVKDFFYRGPFDYGMHFKGLNRLFLPEMKKEGSNKWRIIIKSQEDYFPIALIEDMHKLIDLKIKLEKILKIPDKQKGMVTPIIDIDKDKNPIYKEQRGIFSISCKVKDRIELSKYNKKLDKDLFNGEGISEFIQEIRDSKSKEKLFSEWIKKVDKLEN